MQRIVVIGGGIAGLGTAWSLARRGRSVILLEQGPELAAGSTARSASMFRLAVADPVNVALALRSRELGQQVAPGTLKKTGGIYLCADEAEHGAILRAAAAAGVRAAADSEIPGWLEDRSRPALMSQEDGILDVPALTRALASEARRLGADLRCGVRASVESHNGQVIGVETTEGHLAADTVIDCAGSWSVTLAGARPLGRLLQPKRRHLFILQGDARLIPGIVWDLGEGMYVRAHEEGILASACDESGVETSLDVPTDPTVLDLLQEKLGRWAPSLAGLAVRRCWAGLRPLTSDHRFLVGPDAGLKGLFRVTGFGGHGITAGLAAGDIAAASICGEPTGFVPDLALSRCV